MTEFDPVATGFDDTLGTDEDDWVNKNVNNLTRLGFIGIGRMGQHHLAAARALGATMTGVCRQHWEIGHGTAKTFLDWRGMLDHDDIDGIVVAAPWDVIPKMLPELLASDKPMLIEKPIGLVADELRAVSAAAYPTAGRALVGFNRRFYGPVQALKSRLAEGGLVSAEITISEHLEVHTKRYGKKILPHILAFTSVHTFDLMVHLFGPLTYEGGCVKWGDDGLRHLTSWLWADASEPVILHCHMNDPSPVGIRCRFDDGETWVLSPLESLKVYDRVDITESGQGRSYEPHMRWACAEGTKHKPGILAQMRAFLTQDYGPGATPYDALKALELIEAVQGR